MQKRILVVSKSNGDSIFWKICSHSARPSMQIPLMFITALLFYLSSFWPQRKFFSFDPVPNISRVISSEGQPVKVGMYIRNFIKFDPKNNNFLIDAVVWFEADKSVSEEILGRFTFGKGEIKDKSDATILDLSNGKRLVRYNVRLDFPSNLDHRLFPFGDHILFINLTNRSVSTDKLHFVSTKESLVVSDSIYTVGWKFIDSHVDSGRTLIELEKGNNSKSISAPRSIFSLRFKDISLRDFWVILFPLFIFLFIALFTFSIDLEKYYTSRLSIGVTILSATISYRYVIQNMNPKVESAIFSDYIFFMFFLLIFGAVICNLFLKHKLADRIGLIILMFHIVLNSCWAFLIFYFF